jgi:hypothetical protein
MAALNEMEKAVAQRKQLSVGIDEAAERIQRAARSMLSRLRFRNCLYKLIIFKNIVENKAHKEKLSMLFAFEQLIINTEEQLEEEEALAAEAHERAEREKSRLQGYSQDVEGAQREEKVGSEEGEQLKGHHSTTSNKEVDDVQQEIMKLTNVSSSTSAYILQALVAAQE